MSETQAVNRSALVHELKNYLAIIVGFSELMLGDMVPDDPRRPDLVEVHKAARDAVRVLPEVLRQAALSPEGHGL
jgi:hypothetical protein